MCQILTFCTMTTVLIIHEALSLIQRQNKNRLSQYVSRLLGADAILWEISVI